MDSIRNYLKVQLPRYLKGLPLPRTFAGFLKLKQDDWLYLAPLLLTVFVLLVSIFAGGKSKDPRAMRVNRKISLEKEKVANLVPVKEIEELVAKGKGKCAVCRCWKSKKFPYCDGSHMKHNKETGDNVGPFVLTAE